MMLRRFSLRRIISLTIITALLTASVPSVIARSTAGSTFTATSNLAQSILSSFGALFDYTKHVGSGGGMPSRQQTATTRITPKKPFSKAEREAKVAKLEINSTNNSEIEVGERALFMAVPVDDSGEAVHGLVAAWESDNPEVITIENNGEALARKAGNANLTATAGNKRTTINVSVIDKTTSVATARASVQQRLSKGMKAHPNRLLTSALPQNQLPDTEYRESLYSFQNIVGEVPGKTTPGASVPPAAVSGTEMPGSSNFSFDIPVVGLPGRGLDVNLSLVYNSRLWSKTTTSTGATRMTYNIEKWQTVAPGFQLNFGQIRSQGGVTTYIEPNGTHHDLVDDGSGTGGYITNDGTFIRYNGSSLVTFPDGTQAAFGAAGLIGGNPPASVSQPMKITDRNGNYILIDYLTGVYGYTSGPRRINTIQDSMGRYVRFYYDANKSLVAITVPGYQNGADRQVIRFYYQDITITQPGLFQSWITVNAPTTAHVVRYVYMPGTQAGYRFDYSAYGMVYQIAQLRGMSVSTTALDQLGSVTSEGQQAALTTYNYPGSPSYLTDAPTYTTRTDDWAGRTSAQPVFNFSVDQMNGISSVTAPDGTIAETHRIISSGQWNDGLVNEIIIKQGTTVLSDTVMTWQPGNNGANPRIQQVQVTNEAGQTKAIVYSYDSNTTYNNISAVSERDFAPAGTLGAELRRTETVYQTLSQYLSRGLIHLPTSVKVFKGGQSVPSMQIDYAYDETGLTARPDIIMYIDPATSVRGNMTTMTGYTDASAPGPSTAIPHTQSYDIAGNLITATVDCCQQKSYTYTNAYQYAYSTMESRGNANQLTTSAAYDFNTGLVLSVTDENSRTSTIQYDANTLRPSATYRPDGSYTSNQYGDGLYADPDSSHMHSYVVTRTYTGFGAELEGWQFTDGRGEVARTFRSSPDGYSTTDIEYDIMGRAYRASNPYYSSGSTAAINPSGLWTTTVFDNLGRATSVTMPSGDAQSPTTSAVQTSYAGTVITNTDQAGRQRRQIRDALGRLVRADEPDANGNLGTTSAPVQPTYYDYDVLNNLIHVTQGAQHRYFKYDSLSRLIYERLVEQDAPYTATDTLTGNSSWSRKIVYNSQSLVTDTYDARQINAHTTYDGLNRPSQITYSDGTPTLTYTYDEARAGYYNLGYLTSVTTAATASAPQTVREYDYDQMGRITSHRQKIGATTYTVGYTYSPTGQLMTESYPSGKQIVYTYDTGARLSRVSDGAGATYDNGFAYSAHGGLASETFGNGAVHTITYNNRLQPSQIKLTLSGVEQQRYDYFYGNVQADGSVDTTKNTGQIGRIDSYIAGIKQWDQRFTYDTLGRLSQAGEYQPGQTGQLTYQSHYDYDAWGNRYQYQQNINVPYVPVQMSEIDQSRNRFNALTTYDAAGNVTVDQKFRGMQYQYDANGRQQWAARTDGTNPQSAVYDGLGQRVQTTANGVMRNMVYDIFGQIICEYSQGSLERENIYRGGGLLASNETSAGLKYVLQDHQDSTRLVMSGGSIVARHDYLPFGEEISAGTGLRTTTQGYGATDRIRERSAGMERDDSTGLDNTWWRKYESSSGRWTSPDPYRGSIVIGDGQSLNRYSYVQNDPVNLIDPSGLMCYATVVAVVSHNTETGQDTITRIESVLSIWCDDFGSGPASNPQGNTPLPDNLRDRVKDRVDNPKSDCAEFIKKIIDELNKKSGKSYSNDAMKLFDRVKAEKGFVLKPGLKAKAEANFDGGKRIVYISPVPLGNSPEKINNTQDNYANIALNESLHHARDSGIYTDRDLAKALFNVLSPQRQAEYPLPKTDDLQTNSQYFHSELSRHCPPTGKK